MPDLFGRRVAITLGTFRFVSDASPDGSPVLLDDGSKLYGFRVTFKVERSHESTGNKAQAQIFNANEDSRGKFSDGRPRPHFIIEAGYRDTFGQLFAGEAVEISTTRNAPGIVTTIKAKDGFSASRQRIVKSFAPGANAGDVIADIAKSLGINASKAIARAKAGDFTGGIQRFFNGVSLSGNSKAEMDKFARTYGFDWSIQDGELQMLLPEETTKEEAVLLSADTGLIGSPARVYDDMKPRAVIMKGRSLLNPKIRPGRRLELESVEVSGSFRALKVEHAGQSDGGDFYSDWEALEIK